MLYGILQLVYTLLHVCSSTGEKAYVIPAGGSSALGAWGYIDAFDEMMQQVTLFGVVCALWFDLITISYYTPAYAN